MQIHRLLEMIPLLMKHKSMTAAQLARHFEVSTRTVLRDVEALSAAGIPVYTLQGRGGGIAIMESCVLSHSLLSQEEQNRIVLALQSLSAAGQPETDRLLAKLEGLFSKAETDWIEVDFSRWVQQQADSRRFDLLKHAILNQRAVAFIYAGSNGEKTRRRVYPFKLLFKSRGWYLQSFCTEKRDWRTFKLVRMLQLQETGESFVRADYSPPSPEVQQTPPAPLTPLELEFPPQAAWRLYDEFDEGAIQEGENGFFRVRANLPEDNWLYAFLLSFGGDVRVIAPAHLQKILAEKRGIT